MQRALVAGLASALFAVTILPAALTCPPPIGAVVIAMLTCVPSVHGALNGALMHTMVRPEAIARGTGIYTGFANVLSSLGEPIFGQLVTLQGGEYWGGFLFLATLNLLTATGYLMLHRINVNMTRAGVVAGPSNLTITET